MDNLIIILLIAVITILVIGFSIIIYFINKGIKALDAHANRIVIELNHLSDNAGHNSNSFLEKLNTINSNLEKIDASLKESVKID